MSGPTGEHHDGGGSSDVGTRARCTVSPWAQQVTPLRVLPSVDLPAGEALLEIGGDGLLPWRDDWHMSAGELERVREIALSLPGVGERLSHGAPSFFVHETRPLCYFHDHHNDDRVLLWCPAAPGAQEALVAAEPERFFAPPTSARGTFATWIGVYLDRSGDAAVDWGEVAEVLMTPFAW